ncbi:MAG: hypothetical protein V3V08_14400 [Nannocystaceae bacterium]
MSEQSRPPAPVASEFLLYAAPDGDVNLSVLFRDETAWLTQKGLAELFDVQVPAINKHLKNSVRSVVSAGLGIESESCLDEALDERFKLLARKFAGACFGDRKGPTPLQPDRARAFL